MLKSTNINSTIPYTYELLRQGIATRSSFKTQKRAQALTNMLIAKSPSNPQPVPRATNENLTSNIPVPPWSRSKSERFTGPGSLYAPAQEEKPTPKHTTPQKPAGMPAMSDRYATQAERALYTPTKPPTPSAAYVSTTDRFKLPGGIYLPSSSPGVGAYDVKASEAKIRGAVKLQKAIRRRQSRGIFSEVELKARETPSPGRYNKPSGEAVAESPVGHVAFSKDDPRRFEGPRSIYAQNDVPDAGEYDPFQAQDVVGGGAKSAFSGAILRFGGPHSIYSKEDVPGVGSYDVPGGFDSDQNSARPSSLHPGKHGDRFTGLYSVYNNSDAPGVGAYNVQEDPQNESLKHTATYSSTTDRFKLKGSVYDVAAASTPGVGTYDPKPTEAKIRGAVKLQNAIRRRQSRGIFAQIEAHAREVPSPGKYTRGYTSFSCGPAISKRAHIRAGEMNAPDSGDAAQVDSKKDAFSKKNSGTPNKKSVVTTATTPTNASAAFVRSTPKSASQAQASTDSKTKNTSATTRTTPIKMIEAQGRVLDSAGRKAGVKKAPAAVSQPKETTIQAGVNDFAGGDRYSVGGTAVGVYKAPRFSGASRVSAAFSDGGTALDAYLPVTFGLPNVNEASEPIVIDGEKWYSFRSATSASSHTVVLDSEHGDEDEGRALFAQLGALDPKVCQDDYFSSTGGWDVQGLKSDIELYVQGQ